MSEKEARGPTLLFVEDEAEARDLTGEALQFRYPELQVYTADNGAAGLEMFRQIRPQIVVTDIRMPQMDGLEMAAAIKAIEPVTHIIAITAYSDKEFMATAADVGFSEYLLKPIDYEQLFASIDKIINGNAIAE